MIKEFIQRTIILLIVSTFLVGITFLSLYILTMDYSNNEYYNNENICKIYNDTPQYLIREYDNKYYFENYSIDKNTLNELCGVTQ